MIFCGFPIGSFHGWGVLGKNFALELSQISNISLLDSPQIEDVAQELEYSELKKLAGQGNLNPPSDSGTLITALLGDKLKASHSSDPNVSHKIGYAVFENTVFSPTLINQIKKEYESIVVPSNWCKEQLEFHSINDSTVIYHGVDTNLFSPAIKRRNTLQDKFVIFSGGKLEYRKGQDLVIRAVASLIPKYPDIVLVNSWYNPWPESLMTLQASPHINFKINSGDYEELVTTLLHENGISFENHIVLQPKPNFMMPTFYQATDIGIFPNRCEGATNMVLMEYMACGKPVIATNWSGQSEVLTESNSLHLNDSKKFPIQVEGKLFAEWREVKIEELISQIEWAYHNRERINSIGDQARKTMLNYSWKRMAQEFHQLVPK